MIESFFEFFESPDDPNWPNCITPDCEYKQCTWSAMEYCFTCCERQVGPQEMIRRYNATHDITWEEEKWLDELEDEELEDEELQQ